MNKILAVAVLVAAGFAADAGAVDGASIEIGTGNDGVDLWRLGLQRSFGHSKPIPRTAWQVGGYWDFTAGTWYGTSRVYDFGFTPVYRITGTGSLSPYFEGAIGLHVISNLHIADHRDFTTRFQFGDHIGAGVRYGEQQRYDLGIRLQHLSNGGIRNPNPGVNFLQLRLQYHFR